LREYLHGKHMSENEEASLTVRGAADKSPASTRLAETFFSRALQPLTTPALAASAGAQREGGGSTPSQRRISHSPSAQPPLRGRRPLVLQCQWGPGQPPPPTQEKNRQHPHKCPQACRSADARACGAAPRSSHWLSSLWRCGLEGDAAACDAHAIEQLGFGAPSEPLNAVQHGAHVALTGRAASVRGRGSGSGAVRSIQLHLLRQSG
jgi:hypothetical protein